MPILTVTARLKCTDDECQKLATYVREFLESYPDKVDSHTVLATLTEDDKPNWPFPANKRVC
jgi:hypothetical protein